MNFSDKLKSAMQQLGINQAKVVSLTGKSKGSISQYLSGKQVPSEDVQRDIAVSLGLDPDYFTKPDDELPAAVEPAARKSGSIRRCEKNRRNMLKTVIVGATPTISKK